MVREGMIVLDRPAVIFCYEFSQEIVDVDDKETCIGRAFFSQSGTHISFSALVHFCEDGKFMRFEKIQFRSYDEGWSQSESFFNSLLEIRCLMALEQYLANNNNESFVELGRKLSSTYTFHGPWHFWDHLQMRDLEYLTKNLQLSDSEERN